MKRTLFLTLGLALVATSLQAGGAKDSKWVQVPKGTKLAECYQPYTSKVSDTESAQVCTPQPGKVYIKRKTGTDPDAVCYDVCDTLNGTFTKGWQWTGLWGKSNVADRCQCQKN